MPAQIFAFQLRRGQGIDWTQEELAELYRIEHALVQSGLSVEHDRGQTDEGDPWFVFCRPDGEVLIHLTRFDGLYRLHSPALSAPLIGRSFGDLTKAFAEQMPFQVVLPRSRGARLYVHPASLLALIVGTIFLAAQDVLPPEGTPEAARSGGDGEAVAAHPLKSLLQSTFQAHFEAVVGWFRDGGLAQQSIAWTVISTLTAVLTGLTDALTHHGDAVVVNTEEAQLADSVRTDESSSDSTGETPSSHNALDLPVKLASLDADNPVVAADFDKSEPQHDQAISSQPAVKIVAPPQFVDAEPAAGSMPKALNPAHGTDHVGLGADGQMQAQPEIFWHASVATPAKSSSDGSAAGAPSVNSGTSSTSSTSSVAVNDLLNSLATTSTSGNSQAGFTEIANLMAHATAVDLSKTDWAFLLHPATSTQVDSTTASASIGPIAKPFDAQAAVSLESFLQANPHAQAIFDDHNIVIYDTDNSSHTSDSVLNVWKFSDGSTITLVGTADHHLATLV